MTQATETPATSFQEALRAVRQRAVVLVGQVGQNQDLPTFTGRMTLEQFTELTVVHNKKWADDAGETVDAVTQREIIDAHASALATFILKGLLNATINRIENDKNAVTIVERLRNMQDKLGKSAHYGLPPVTLVIAEEPPITPILLGEDVIAAKLTLPAGKLFAVADGQHRREASRRVREFLIEVIANRRIPIKSKIYPAEDRPLTAEELEAWSAIQETFRSWTTIQYEAHVKLSVSEARQMFTNYNCHVKPVKPDINLTFDQSNPINAFAREWVTEQIVKATNGKMPFDLQQFAGIHGFLFLGKPNIKNAPYKIDDRIDVAREFWITVLQSPEWNRQDSLLREVPVLKGLAKAWNKVFLAKKFSARDKAERIRFYIRQTRFDTEWMKSVPGLEAHTVQADNEFGFRFSPAHNDIVPRIVEHALGIMSSPSSSSGKPEEGEQP